LYNIWFYSLLCCTASFNDLFVFHNALAESLRIEKKAVKDGKPGFGDLTFIKFQLKGFCFLRLSHKQGLLLLFLDHDILLYEGYPSLSRKGTFAY